MFIKNKAAKKPEKRLLEILGRLSETQVATLIDFAEFLATRPASAADKGTMGAAEPAQPAVLQPVDIPRPEKESVVKAIKRLAATYPMVDRAKMLNETSTLMTQHIMQGRDAVEVINELEIMFRTRYEAICIKDKKEDEKLPEK